MTAMINPTKQTTSETPNSLCIITARGGSKRIPKKNIKLFNGKPIIAYAIETALASRLFREVMVSTDDEAIAAIAKQYGATVPFMRTPENSNDYAGTAEVLLEVLACYREQAVSFDHLCCIYPTAPFVTVALLNEAYDKLSRGGFDTVYPIQQFSFPIQRAVDLTDDKVSWVDPSSALKRSQDLPQRYHDAGQFYWCNCDALFANKQILTTNSSAIVIHEMQAHDIDTLEDWAIAEFKYAHLHQSSSTLYKK